jgi:hypothetical protein
VVTVLATPYSEFACKWGITDKDGRQIDPPFDFARYLPQNTN